jgi:glutaredoxin
MRLTPIQVASLRRLQKYQTHPPELRERLRMAAIFALALLVPTAIAAFVLIKLEVPGAVYLLGGLYIGAVAREIGQQRMFVTMWPMNHHIIEWSRVGELLSSPQTVPDAATRTVTRKRSLKFLATLGIAVLAFSVVAAFAIERALAFAHDPTRGNPPNNVILLSASWCGYCMSLRQHLTELHVPYTDLDVERTTQGRWAFEAVRGSGVPITIVGDQVIRGVGREPARWRRLDEHLLRAGYSPATNAGVPNGPQAEDESLVSPVGR